MVLRPSRGILAASILAALVLAGCGSAIQPPAAVVYGVPITQSDLAHQLSVVLTDPQLAAQVSGPGGASIRRDYTRRLLSALIEREILERYAHIHHIPVSPGEVDRALGSAIRQVGGLVKFRQVLRQRGLTEREVRQNILDSILSQRVHDAVVFQLVGASASAERANQAFQAWLGRQIRSANVEVNPRFGRLDPRTGTICPIDSTADSASCSQA